ncbi:ATP synthase subunit I [Methyloferula stellata]|uniref:ATP synthase subunit I n=1 Tax=Methyloferula stellata TaxID=876270 RepID=UPI00035FE614|nr:ATP synthase subunit I [Methyloferula stellata]
MSLLAFNGLPAWAWALGLAAHFGAGVGLGLVYFRALMWNARLFALGGRVTTAIGLMIGRFALLGVLLIAASLEGALPLLITALGVLLGRWLVMRRAMDTAS